MTNRGGHKGNIQIFIPDKDGEGSWENINEDNLDLSEHDAEVRSAAIDECIKTLKSSIPYTDQEDIIYGYCCAIERLEQLINK